MLESFHGISDLSTVELLGPNVKFLKSLPYVLLLLPSLDLTFYIRESGCVCILFRCLLNYLEYL